MLDKAIRYGKEYRKPYRRLCEQMDKTCRCHGGCIRCLGNRMYSTKKALEKMKVEE